MNSKLRSHADTIVKEAVAAVLPDEAVRRALRERPLTGKVYLVAAGKAAWQMARAAAQCLEGGIAAGIVVT